MTGHVFLERAEGAFAPIPVGACSLTILFVTLYPCSVMNYRGYATLEQN